MKKVISLIMAAVMLVSVGCVLSVSAQETDMTNKICLIELKDGGYLTATGTERGNALTVGEEGKKFRCKLFAGGKYAFIGEDELAIDVNGASVKEGVTIIQWTSTGSGNQRWALEEAEDGYFYIQSAFSELYMTEEDGVITQEVKDEGKNQLWKITVTGEYEPVVEKMLESEAAKSISAYRYARLCDYILSGGEFNMLTYDKIEKLIAEKDYFALPFDEQVGFVEDCFNVVSTDLMYGSMATKLEKDVKAEYVGIEENAWQSWHGIPDEDARLYNVTITDKETGDEHVIQYISPYDNDEEYAVTVGEAVACFEMPIVKCLWRFVYTSMNTSSWNGGDGTIWNNTGYRGDVNNMVQMFAHELGHVMDNGRVDNNVWYRAIAQDMVPVTGYGNTNRWEDLAEFSRMYLLAKGDKDRIEAIERTYPARTKAYKGLLYALDNEFYKEYELCYEETVNAVGDYKTSEQVTIASDGKYLTDVSGELVLCEEKIAAKNWQIWEVYARGGGVCTVRNKATGKYLTFKDERLNLGEKSGIGFKSVDTGYAIVDASTGFAIGDKLNISVDGGHVWTIEKMEDIPYAGDVNITLSATGEKLTYTSGNDDEAVITDLWTLVPVDKGYYMIQARGSDKVLDISGGSIDEGAKAILYSVTGGDNQIFSLQNNGDGTYCLVLAHSGLKLASGKEGLCQSNGKAGYTKWVITVSE